MSNYTIKPFEIIDVDAIEHIENKYKEHYPDANHSWISAYLFNPSLGYGENIYCITDSSGQMIGNGHVYVIPSHKNDIPHKFFIYIKIDPDLEHIVDIEEQLYRQLVMRASMIVKDLPDRKAYLYVQYYDSEVAILDFFYQKGFQIHRRHEMKRRHVQETLPPLPATHVTIKAWVPTTDEEKYDFLRAKQLGFPDAPLSIEDLNFQMEAPLWKLVSAFSEDNEILSGIMLLQPPWETEYVFTEDIFVIPKAKHQGIGRAMNIYALHELKKLGKSYAMITVDTNNLVAKSLAESLGYKTFKEEVFLTKDLDTALQDL